MSVDVARTSGAAKAKREVLVLFADGDLRVVRAQHDIDDLAFSAARDRSVDRMPAGVQRNCSPRLMSHHSPFSQCFHG